MGLKGVRKRKKNNQNIKYKRFLSLFESMKYLGENKLLSIRNSKPKRYSEHAIRITGPKSGAFDTHSIHVILQTEGRKQLETHYPTPRVTDLFSFKHTLPVRKSDQRTKSEFCPPTVNVCFQI